MDELDSILLEQLQIVRKSKKVLNRHRKILGNDPEIVKGEYLVNKKIEFLESMINDKTLLHKRQRKKKEKDKDILARSIYYEWYRNIFFTTTIGYRMLMDYMSNFRKGKD